MLATDNGGTTGYASLAARLEAARRQNFVGRQAELALFRETLAADPPPYFVLYCYGPGGVGKSTLLREFGHLARQEQAVAISLDSRNIEATPAGFAEALHRAMDIPPAQTPEAWFAGQGRRCALLIDTYERLAPLDGWLRDHFLPRLPANVLVVIADRRKPRLAWRTDPGWRTLLRLVPLRNLAPSESRSYLQRHQIPAEQHRGVLDFTHGHPLALSLVAEQYVQRPAAHFRPGEAPDVIGMLLEQFLDDVPTATHRAALEACALVRLTSEPLLASMLGGDAAQEANVHELFTWMRERSFVEVGPYGLFPHDLAREALATDLRWRNRKRYAELHDRARRFYLNAFEEAGSRQAQRQVLFEYLFLHRDNPVVRPFFEWQQSGSVFSDRPRQDEKELLVEMIATHEGQEAARLAVGWLARFPQGASVFRDASSQLQGLLLRVPLEQTTVVERDRDPALAAAWEHLEAHAPLRPGERATHFRFWMAADAYQSVSPVQSQIFISMVQHYLATQGLAYTFVPCADPDFWLPVFTHVDLQRIPDADYTLGGRHYGVYGHDWRATPPLAWLALLAERELGGETAAAPAPAEQLLVLSEEDFSAAVRDALRHLHDDVALARNPLLRSRLVVEAAGRGESEEAGAAMEFRCPALRALLQDAAAALQQNPRQRKFWRPLHHTYFEPRGTQEETAEALDLPFSTYRRYLRRGIAAVTAALWQRELGSA